MAISRGMIVMVALLCVSHLHNADAAVKSSSFPYYYPQKNVFFNNYGIKDGILVYLVCDDYQNDKITNLTCTLVQRQYPVDKIARSCNVTLFTQPENDYIARPHVQAFGQDNALLLWGEMVSRSTFNLMAIQMNDCKTKTWQFDDPRLSMYSNQRYTHKILTYDNDFDIFFDPNAVMEGWAENQVGMRMSFDHEPQPLYDVIKKIEKGEKEVTFMSPISMRSPAKGYVYTVMGEQGTTSVILVKPDGTRTMLSSAVNSHIMTSANYGYITLCVKSATKSQLICTQYDEDGEIKFEVPIDHDIKAHFTIVHSTPHGGFLLLTASLDNNYNTISYDVHRVDSKGEKKGSVRSIGFAERTYWDQILNVWENGDGYCTAFVRQRAGQWDNLQVDVDCFSDNDFSM